MAVAPEAQHESFEPRLDILPQAQRRLWGELGATPRDFVLYGGTAIALRLGHRQSEDFDFFSNRPFDPERLAKQVPYMREATVRQVGANTLVCEVQRNGPVQVAFFGGLEMRRVNDPSPAANGIQVASVLDLACSKLKTVLFRGTLKDYLDVDALLGAGIALPEALAAARALYPSPYDPYLTLKALMYFGDGDVPRLPLDAQRRLSSAAKAALPLVENLPHVATQAGLTPEELSDERIR